MWMKSVEFYSGGRYCVASSAADVSLLCDSQADVVCVFVVAKFAICMCVTV